MFNKDFFDLVISMGDQLKEKLAEAKKEKNKYMESYYTGKLNQFSYMQTLYLEYHPKQLPSGRLMR